MLETGLLTEKNGQRAEVGGKPAEGRRALSLRPRCLFLTLLLGAVFFISYMIMHEMSPDWNLKWLQEYNVKQWWTSLQGESLVSPTTKNSGTAEKNSAAPHHEQNVTAGRRATQAPQVAPVPITPVPYKSPGPYLVEYPYRYHFVINEALKCQQQKPFVVLVVPVAPHNRADRDIVRSTWGGVSSVLDRAVTMVFLLGVQGGEEGEKVQDQLLEESRQHGDLIQSSFLDCYKNLTIKTMVMLEWLDAYCPSAAYAMKIDADMFLNVQNLVRMLVNAPKTNYFTGLVATNGLVLRDPGSKWYVPVEIFAESVYPPYALGLGYVLSLDLPKKLVQTSSHIIPIYIEDVFLGLCMKDLSIRLTPPPAPNYFCVNPVRYSRCAYSKLVATTTDEKADRMKNWKDFKKPGPYC